ncbi:hypothetical protein ACGFZR_15265 [Streptomyces sp. NPDC048241]|uniref:hypothetical protein n=1 Tax=Streptomyces sp. NPDC048241 TaxID=3365521 RepID=UPI003722296B
MASNILSAPQCADRQGLTLADRLAHEAASHVRVNPVVAREVTRFEVASARYTQLAAMDARRITPAEFDALATARQTMAIARATLAAAGQLHLIEAGQ